MDGSERRLVHESARRPPLQSLFRPNISVNFHKNRGREIGMSLR